jgi:hypothetical protein
MFSEYCSEPFVVEPVEVQDAAGTVTGGRGGAGGVGRGRGLRAWPGPVAVALLACTLHAPLIPCFELCFELATGVAGGAEIMRRQCRENQGTALA